MIQELDNQVLRFLYRMEHRLAWYGLLGDVIFTQLFILVIFLMAPIWIYLSFYKGFYIYIYLPFYKLFNAYKNKKLLQANNQRLLWEAQQIQKAKSLGGVYR